MPVQLTWRRFELQLEHRWTIARTQRADGPGGDARQTIVLVRLEAPDGSFGVGEAAPCARYRESPETVEAFLRRVDPDRLHFDDLAASSRYLASLSGGDHSAKGAVDIALVDGAAKRAGKPVTDFLGVGFTEGRHKTSFSIGIDRPEVVREKVLQAAALPILKLKLGSPDDRLLFRALREAAPEKPVRVDANEAWHTKEEALRQIEWLAEDRRVQFVEQPMPAGTAPADLAWLKERSPLLLMADEGYERAEAIEQVVPAYHAVNVKLVKTGGITPGLRALQTARAAGLKTMLGCMIETSVLITAAAHLADLTDYLDLDGNLLITNDPYQGVQAVEGRLSFANAPAATGLRVSAREV